MILNDFQGVGYEESGCDELGKHSECLHGAEQTAPSDGAGGRGSSAPQVTQRLAQWLAQWLTQWQAQWGLSGWLSGRLSG